MLLAAGAETEVVREGAGVNSFGGGGGGAASVGTGVGVASTGEVAASVFVVAVVVMLVEAATIVAEAVLLIASALTVFVVVVVPAVDGSNGFASAFNTFPLPLSVPASFISTSPLPSLLSLLTNVKFPPTGTIFGSPPLPLLLYPSNLPAPNFAPSLGPVGALIGFSS